MKKTISMLLAIVMAVCLILPAAAEDIVVTGGIAEIQKYGNLVLDIAPDALKDAGFQRGDMLVVTVDGKSYDIPLCTNYSDVDTGSMVLCDTGELLIVAINMGDFATSNKIAEKITAKDKSYTWERQDGRPLSDIAVSIQMGEKGGYLDQYLIRQLVRTNERDDYSSDAVFANFRNVAVGSLGKNALFRSSSPVSNELGRAAYADALIKENGIQTVMNLTDNSSAIQGYIAAEGFASPYYQSLYENGKVISLNLGIDFSDPSFWAGVAEGLRFFAANKGPYLVHCTEGKDRAGLVAALLECLMDGTYDELAADYMISYENYYHLTPGSEQYEAVKSNNFAATLAGVTGAGKDADLSRLDLAAGATGLLKSLGLTDEEIGALKDNLSADYMAAAAASEAPATYTVVKGDSLWRIAKRLYGDGGKYSLIYNANRGQIKNPNAIFVGQILVIPAV